MCEPALRPNFPCIGCPVHQPTNRVVSQVTHRAHSTEATWTLGQRSGLYCLVYRTVARTAIVPQELTVVLRAFLHCLWSTVHRIACHAARTTSYRQSYGRSYVLPAVLPLVPQELTVVQKDWQFWYGQTERSCLHGPNCAVRHKRGRCGQGCRTEVKHLIAGGCTFGCL